MSRKQNYSSSSKFSLNVDELDRRFNKRKEIQEEALEEMQQHVRDTLDKYVDNDIVIRDNLEEYLLRNLLFKFINR